MLLLVSVPAKDVGEIHQVPLVLYEKQLHCFRLLYYLDMFVQHVQAWLTQPNLGLDALHYAHAAFITHSTHTCTLLVFSRLSFFEIQIPNVSILQDQLLILGHFIDLSCCVALEQACFFITTKQAAQTNVTCTQQAL